MFLRQLDLLIAMNYFFLSGQEMWMKRKAFKLESTCIDGVKYPFRFPLSLSLSLCLCALATYSSTFRTRRSLLYWFPTFFFVEPNAIKRCSPSDLSFWRVVGGGGATVWCRRRTDRGGLGRGNCVLRVRFADPTYAAVFRALCIFLGSGSFSVSHLPPRNFETNWNEKKRKRVNRLLVFWVCKFSFLVYISEGWYNDIFIIFGYLRVQNILKTGLFLGAWGRNFSERICMTVGAKVDRLFVGEFDILFGN